MAGEIASAFVSLMPSMAGFQGEIEREGSGPMRGASRNLGKILTAGLLGAGAAAGAALAEAIGQEKDVAKMSAALGLSPAESKRLGGVAGDLYRDAYGASFGEVTDAVGLVTSSIAGMSSASKAELQGVTATVLDVSEAFGEDLTAVTAGVGSLMRNGLAPDAEAALDIITKGMQSSANLGGDLLDVIGEYGSTFSDAGLSGEQAIGLLNQALAAGIPNADFAADAIREMGIIIGEGSEESAAALSELGLSASGIQAGFLEGGSAAASALDTVLDALRNTEDPLKRNALATTLVGTQYEDLGDALLALDPSQALTSLGSVDGAAAKLGDTLNNNAAENLTRFQRQITQTFVDFVGGRALPVVNSIASALATHLGPSLQTVGTVLAAAGVTAQQFAGWVDANQRPIKVVAGLITALFVPALIAMGVQATISAAKTVAAFIAQRVAAVGWMLAYSAVVALTVAGWVLMGVQALLGAAKVAAAWLIAMGPIALVIAAVVGLGVLIYKNWDKIKVWTAAAWEWIVAKVKGTFEMVVGVVKTVLGFIGSVFNFYLNGFKLVWGTIFGAIKKGVELYMRGVKLYIEMVVGAIRGVFNGMRSLVGLVVGFFINIKNGIVNQWNTLIGFLTGLPGRVTSALSGMWNVIKDGFKSALNTIIGWWNDFSLTIDIPDAIPGLPNEWTISTPRIPMLAEGGIVNRATLAVIGEAGPEAVVPLPRLGEFASGAQGSGSRMSRADLDYLADRILDGSRAIASRPNLLTIDERAAYELRIRQDRAYENLAPVV